MADPLWKVREAFAALKPKQQTAFLAEAAKEHGDEFVAAALVALGKSQHRQLLLAAATNDPSLLVAFEAVPEELLRAAVKVMHRKAGKDAQQLLLAEEARDVLSRYAGNLVIGE